MDSFNLNVLDIADWIAQRARQDEDAGDLLTHLKLQKMLYYSQAWVMIFSNKSLFQNDFEAWAHGPVIRQVWDALAGVGRSPVESVPGGNGYSITEEEILDTLEEVWGVYGSKTAKALERLSHSERPWLDARGDLPELAPCTEILPKEAIRSYYEQRNAALQQAA
ncbi:MAG: Panacea domain-containing protein [Janthinobacterium lividum]